MIQIAHIESPFGAKFGVPRQAGLAAVEARVVFEPEFRVAEAVRGLEDFDYVWLIWMFHLNGLQDIKTSRHQVVDGSLVWSPTVRPPRLGGNRRVGVFASRSPFRPNPLGLSAVRLLAVEHDAQLGPVLRVEGADLVDGTPILDIKPYVPYADSRPDARGGFAPTAPEARLRVEDPEGLTDRMDARERETLFAALALDPRPSYQHDPQRVYTMPFAGCEVSFRVEEDRVVIVKKC